MHFSFHVIFDGLNAADEVCMLILSVLQALVGRYYPWRDTSELPSGDDRPCLVCWILGRLLEALWKSHFQSVCVLQFIYLLVVLRAVGPATSHVTRPQRDSSNLSWQ